jgi:hypothetical protein
MPSLHTIGICYKTINILQYVSIYFEIIIQEKEKEEELQSLVGAGVNEASVPLELCYHAHKV